VTAAGFMIATSEQRGPLEHEHQSHRIYLLAERAD
jgi:hypothetical protein